MARAAALVKQVLGFARGMGGTKVPIAARHVMRDVAAMLDATLFKDVNVHMNTARELPLVLADPMQLHQVLLSLAVNAAQAMRGHGDLWLTAEPVQLSADEKTLYVTNGGTLVAFDVQADGALTNQRDFGKLRGGELQPQQHDGEAQHAAQAELHPGDRPGRRAGKIVRGDADHDPGGVNGYHAVALAIHARDLGAYPICFMLLDAPMLDGRATMHRQRGGFEALRQLDLLLPARVAYRGLLPSCRLVEIEHALLGMTRPPSEASGAEAPGWYFRFLRTQDARHLVPLITHNADDVLSLVALLARFAAVDGGEGGSGLEQLALGRLHAASGDAVSAQHRLEAARAILPPSIARDECLFALAVPAAASAQVCPYGLVAVDPTHCCWPGQTFAADRGTCAGAPQCPAGLGSR